MSATNSVIDRVDRGWRELDALVDSLGPAGLSITGADGWAVKDHLIHIGAWEHSLIALLDGADIAKAMGAPGQEETDVINAAVWALHRDKTPEQALAYFHDTHAQLMARLRRLTEDDLKLAYDHYQPNDPKGPPDGDRPVIEWVAGDTYDHYAEHIDWINQLIDASTAR
jgi:Protein of unknown function (DUF1706)